jgi:hydrogenase maturation protease
MNEEAPISQSAIRNPQSAIVVIGVGNEYRGDDAVGLVVVRKLKGKNLPDVRVMEASGEGAALLEHWKNEDVVILIDAVHSGAEPGTIHRLDAHAQPIPIEFFRYSTHAFSVVEAIELARALNQLPPRLIVYGIESENFEAGVGLSLKVEKAAQKVMKCVAQEVLDHLQNL